MVHYEYFSAKTGRHRTSVPSATFVNYDTPPSNTNMIEKARTDSKIELLSHCENTEPQTNDIQPEENGVNGKHIGFLQTLM